jgi:hypothetical protein
LISKAIGFSSPVKGVCLILLQNPPLRQRGDCCCPPVGKNRYFRYSREEEKMHKSSVLIFLIPAMLWAQGIKAENTWEPFEYFVGKWEGNSSGKAGLGKGERNYTFVMKETYLFCKNIMRFEPQEKNPEGEVHEDQAFFSYDKTRGIFVMRQFNIEGFVNQFTMESLSPDKKKFVFVTESSENAPPGLKARITYKIKNKKEFVETFELGFPGQEYSCYMTNTWRRK